MTNGLLNDIKNRDRMWKKLKRSPNDLSLRNK